MKVFALLAVIVGGSMAAPAKLDGLDHHQHHHHGDHHHHEDGHVHDPLARLLPVSTNFAGYDYEPPAVPSGLYELPVTTPPPPPTPVDSYLPPVTTTPPPPPPPPASGYLPPVTTQEPAGNVPVVVSVPPETKEPVKVLMPMPYDFTWAVQDPDTGNSFSHVENSNGVDVTGEYSVLLPDNRLQIVRFTSDPVNGYQAEVSYEPAK